jgi:hypothetical protein
MPNGNRLELRPPMRCLGLGGILLSSAPPTPQAVDPVENAGGPLTPRACEQLAEPAKRRRCVGVGHEEASELALVIALDELDPFCARNNAQPVEPTLVVLLDHGPDPTTHDRFEQSHMLEISQVDCAPMLNLICRTEMMRSPRAYATHGLPSSFLPKSFGKGGQGRPWLAASVPMNSAGQVK